MNKHMPKETSYKLSFKPGIVTKSLLSCLQERTRDVIERRYGLTGKEAECLTIEAIGQIYDITRERVRQIENFALDTIRKSEVYIKNKPAFDELEDYFTRHGGIAKEEIILNELGKDKSTKNQIIFILELGESFVLLKEDDQFHDRWTTNREVADQIHTALEGLHKSLSYEDLIAEAEMIERFNEHLRGNIKDYVSGEQTRSWLGLSKNIGSNPIGEWGLADSPNIRTRGVRDYAYLVLRQHGKPLHFTDVAGQIEEMFDRNAHVATTHNELIKDDRFVLVGRGMYALSEWGYANGVVREVIKSILKDNGPMSKEDVIKEVMKQRQVKENTINVNLQNPRYFKKDQKGKYQLV